MADRKISDLTALTTPASGDYLPIVDISEAAAASKNKRITIEELMRGVPDGTAAAPGIAFETDPNTGIYSPGADQLAVATNGTGRLFIDASGNVNIDSGTFYVDATNNVVGIGSSNPSAYGSNALLINNNTLTINQDGASEPILQFRSGTATQLGRIQYPPTGLRFVNVSGAAETLRITSAGLVGIGVSAPAERLHISGNMRLTGAGGAAETVFAEINAVNGATTSNPGVKIVATTGGTTSRHELAFYTTANNATNTTEKVRIAYNGNVGIGNNAPSQLLEVGTTSAGGNISIVSSSSGANGYLSLVGLDGNAKLQIFSETTTAGFYTPASIPLIFYVSNAERARIDSSGRLLVGTSTGIVTGSSVQAALQVVDNSNLSAAFRMNRNDSSGPIIAFGKSRSTSDGGFAVLQSGDELGAIRFAGADGGDLQTQGAAISAFVDGTPGANDMPGRLVFSTTSDSASSPTERMRIDRNGLVDIGGYGNAGLSVTTPVGTPLQLNRTGNDGELVRFKQDGTTEGNITVSGTTVSYNGAHLARWSQLASGAERTEILRGSVLSNLDEMCEWSEEDNEQLNRMKVSDVEGDPNVSGVFQSWDDDDDTYTDDFYCAMTGDFIIRIAEGVTVERGDLLMSAGDGTAKPQDDDIIRSKTIAKVTSTNVSCTYADGSYCVPCVLMAC
jgi:hypothetical protein